MRQRAVVILLGIFIGQAALFIPAVSGLYAAEIEALPLETRSTEYYFNNGLTLIIKEDYRTPTLAISLFIRTGSATEAEHMGSGITHFIEHMIFKGTSTRDAQQIQAQIKALGADVDAYTTFDYTAFKIQGPGNNAVGMLDIFYDIITNPQFSKEEFEKEKNVIKKEIKLIQDEPGQYLSQQFWQAAYLVHPYRNPIIGYEDLLDMLTPNDLKAYYDKFYTPEKMVLVVVGDIEAAQIKEKISERFGRLKRSPYAGYALPQEPNQLSWRYKEVSYATSKAHMMMGFHSVDMASKDLYALDTLAILLGQGNSSILYRRLHNKLNLAYNIGAYNYTPFNNGIFVIYATFDPDNKQKVIDGITNEIGELENSPVNKNELDKAKNQVISSYIFSRQSQESQADDLGISKLLTGDMDFSKRYVEGVNSVTAHDIMDAANKYLKKENMTAVVLMPQELEAKETPPKAKPSAARAVVKKSLRNGVRLLLCGDKTLPLASVRVNIKGGLRAETQENNGVSNITALMLTKGTASRNEEQVFSEIESLGGALSAYSANNSLGVSLDIMSKDLEKGIELLGDLVSHPVFAEDRLKLLKNDVLAQIRLMDDDIFASTEKRLRQKLFEAHPYGMVSIGRPESVNKINRRDILSFYRDYCVGSNIVISVCGDIDAKRAYGWLSSAFGGIRKRGPPAFKAIDIPAVNGQVAIRDNMDKKEAVVMIGFRSVAVDNPDRYPLQVLSSIFSGGGGRLFASIRQKMGMAYTLGTFGMTGIDTGSFIFYVAVSAENVDSVKDEVISQIKRVCEGDITQEDMDSAKKLLISKYQIDLQVAGAFAMQTALDELYGLGFDNYLKYPALIENLSREEIIQVANRYLNTENCVIAITTPVKNE